MKSFFRNFSKYKIVKEINKVCIIECVGSKKMYRVSSYLTFVIFVLFNVSSDILNIIKDLFLIECVTCVRNLN